MVGTCHVAPLESKKPVDGLRSGFGRNKTVRILVNPGGSVKWKLVDWYRNKAPTFPKGAVYIDEQDYCKNVVSAYTDCTGCRANKLTPSQVGKGGYVYYYDSEFTKKMIFNYNPTRYDSNEYKVLIEAGIKKYEIISLEVKESSALKDVKKVSSTTKVINTSSAPVDYEKSVALAITQSSSWDHSIHWEVGTGVEVSVGTPGVASITGSINAKIGGNHQWGGSETYSTTATDTARIQVPGNHGVKIHMMGTQTQKDVPYKAKVRLTYDDDTTRTGKKVIIC